MENRINMRVMIDEIMRCNIDERRLCREINSAKRTCTIRSIPVRLSDWHNSTCIACGREWRCIGMNGVVRVQISFIFRNNVNAEHRKFTLSVYTLCKLRIFLFKWYFCLMQQYLTRCQQNGWFNYYFHIIQYTYFESC